MEILHALAFLLPSQRIFLGNKRWLYIGRSVNNTKKNQFPIQIVNILDVTFNFIIFFGELVNVYCLSIFHAEILTEEIKKGLITSTSGT